jgi:ribonuclease Z
VSENGLKRKRESSPELPSKRTFLDLTVPAVDGPSIRSTGTPLLDRFSDDPQFDPAALEGDEAEAWRQLIIEHMFTWIEPPPKPRLTKPQKKRAKRGQNVGDVETPETPPSQVEPSLTSLPQVPHWVEDTPKSQGRLLGRAPKGANIAGSLKSLPTFTSPMREASTAYIVVGPHFRGKFDVKRAEELGLQGPLRGRVARGETVTFTVDNGAGERVQRTVRPEDCIGEQETAKVRFLTSVPGLMC